MMCKISIVYFLNNLNMEWFHASKTVKILCVCFTSRKFSSVPPTRNRYCQGFFFPWQSVVPARSVIVFLFVWKQAWRSLTRWETFRTQFQPDYRLLLFVCFFLSHTFLIIAFVIAFEEHFIKTALQTAADKTRGHRRSGLWIRCSHVGTNPEPHTRAESSFFRQEV